MTIDLQIGDNREVLLKYPDNHFDCVITSPPYWGLRNYQTVPVIFDAVPDCEHTFETIDANLNNENRQGLMGSTTDNIDYQKGLHGSGESKSGFCSKCGAWRGQLGLEPTPELFVKHLVNIFDVVYHKLAPTGNCFINLGDTYSGSGNGFGSIDPKNKTLCISGSKAKPTLYKSLPPKCLCLIPEKFALGMIEHGWILRNKIIWYKPNHMPEAVTDRLTKSYEVIYHFVKQGKYYYDLDAVREPFQKSEKINNLNNKNMILTENQVYDDVIECSEKGKNPGDVWQINTQPYSKAHFATFPLSLVEKPILAGCPVNGWVLDPFAGSGTVGEFCNNNYRNAVLIELNPEYRPLIVDRANLKQIPLSKMFSYVR